jgi:cytoskeletal protein RodZ
MIGRMTQKRTGPEDTSQQGFDDFTMRLGDVMRGERATLGKSLLDVQRELRIKASYIAAIENCDPSVFDTPGFIAGYVRSYARYLGMDPDEAFAHFCTESGFSVAHGMSQKASTIRKPKPGEEPRGTRARNPLSEPLMPFAPASEGFLANIEPRAIGSSLVLVGLIAGIGYGGYSVLQEVQRVQLSPVDQTPVVLSELDPLDAAISPSAAPSAEERSAGVFTPPTTEAFDRLYRPQALDVPVLVARDAPISTLDPDGVGVFGGRSAGLPEVQDSTLAASALAEQLVAGSVPEEAGAAAPSAAAAAAARGVTVVAARPAWVQVKDEGGKVLYSRVMNAGDSYAVPRDARAPQIQVGESGAVYFTVAGTTYGPSGQRGAVTSGISLVAGDLTQRYEPAKPGRDDDLMAVLVAMDLPAPGAAPAAPQVAEAAPAPEPVLRIKAPRSPTPTLRPAHFAQYAPVEPAPTPETLVAEAAAPVAREEPAAPAVPLPQVMGIPGGRPDGSEAETEAPRRADAPQPAAERAPQLAAAEPEAERAPQVPQVTATPAPGITVVATAPTWVEISLPSGQKIFAAEMQAGDTFKVPQTAEAAKIFSGNAGGVFFAMNGETYGPYGESGQFGRNLQLAASDISARLQVADLTQNQTLARVVAELNLQGSVPQR